MALASLAGQRPLHEDAIRSYVAITFDGVDVEIASQEGGAPEIAWGDTFFIYDPNREFEGPRRFPFATIVIKDYGDFDNASQLDRPGVFRLNIGVSKETFVRLFPDENDHDFTALDVLMPHPVYGKNHWVCILNPSDASFEKLGPLLAEAYEIAVKRAGPRSRASGGG
ncbi:MAG TPA: DUF6194 family protein [Candidatus Limnocylindrales bacterium]|nr:DUF6194 family protein [Candidatus Limnocylindrales bacterium]